MKRKSENQEEKPLKKIKKEPSVTVATALLQQFIHDYYDESKQNTIGEPDVRGHFFTHLRSTNVGTPIINSFTYPHH